MLAGLAHPHIVPVHDFGVYEGIPYLVMQYAPHGSLRTVHPRGTRLSLASIASYLTPLAIAIHYAHEHGITHRDISLKICCLAPTASCSAILVWRLCLPILRCSLCSTSLVQRPIWPPNNCAAISARLPISMPWGSLSTNGFAVSLPLSEIITRLLLNTLWRLPLPCALPSPTLSPSIELVILNALAKDPHERYSSVMTFANTLLEALHPLEAASPCLSDRSPL